MGICSTSMLRPCAPLSTCASSGDDRDACASLTIVAMRAARDAATISGLGPVCPKLEKVQQNRRSQADPDAAQRR